MTVITESIGEDGRGQPIMVERELDDNCQCGECGLDSAQHVYHHYDSPTPKVSVEVERNSRGYNYKAGVSGCHSVSEAISLLKETMRQIQAEIAPADKNKAGGDEVKGGQ